MPFNNRGNVLKELQRVDEALESYDKAIASIPTMPGLSTTVLRR